MRGEPTTLSKETIRTLELMPKGEQSDSKFIAKAMDLVFDKENKELTDGKPSEVLKKVMASVRMEPILGMIKKINRFDCFN